MHYEYGEKIDKYNQTYYSYFEYIMKALLLSKVITPIAFGFNGEVSLITLMIFTSNGTTYEWTGTVSYYLN